MPTLPSPVTRPSVRTPPATPFTSVQLGDLVARFAEQRGLWLPHVRFESPDRYYTRLEHSESHEVWLLSWLPGQGTDIHGHGGSRGAFTVVRGELTESVFPPTAHRRHPKPRKLLTGTARTFGPRYIHQVTNEAVAPAVSIHAYSPPLSTMSYYRQLHDGRLVTDP
ncbi:cysteine dioxygenase family protein [Streptomyces sp. NPDC047028]|uniref:cysteine dioxygenase n=1 Tax=Streptomyces sp. NPDC047028 TaxID=3155793 RepID=UPI0033DA63D7